MSADPEGGYWGCLYDESRRNRVLVRPPRGPLLKVARLVLVLGVPASKFRPAARGRDGERAVQVSPRWRQFAARPGGRRLFHDPQSPKLDLSGYGLPLL